MGGLSTVERRGSRQVFPTPSRGRGITPRVEVELSPRAVEQVATRVAQLLSNRQSDDQPWLISAGELALKLGVERPWVYRNRDLLGGTRLGSGPKARWRFEYDAAVRRLRAVQGGAAKVGGSR